MFFLLVLYVLAQASAAFAIAMTLRLRGDETTGLADPLLTTPVRRSRWAGAEIVMAATGTAVALAGLGLAAGLTSGLLLGDPGAGPSHYWAPLSPSSLPASCSPA